MGTRVHLAVNGALLREGLAALLRDLGCEPVADPEAADVVLAAVGVPGEEGLDYLREADHPRILAVGGGLQVLLAALQLGARGCLPLSAQPQELAQAVAAVARGEAYIHPSLAEAVLANYRQRMDGREAPAVLTPREREVLVLLAEGYTNRAIAERLHLSVRTVESHRASIMAKLDADSLADLIFAAIRMGLITP